MHKEKIKTAICWILVIICMGVIFWLSSRTANESAAQSGGILEWLTKRFGDNFFTDFIVRKPAHFLEFTGLCLLFNIVLFQTKEKTMPLTAAALTSAYAATDEFHQLFVEGRSCQLSDWAIDTCGAILAGVCFIIILKLIKKCKLKKSVDSVGN